MDKLLKAQQEIKAIVKDKANPYFKSKYADINDLLAEVKPILNDNGLVITQPIKVVDGRNVLRTYITDTEKGEVITASEILLPDIQDPQKMGSAITYYRRYSIQSLLALEAEDDDGNTASGHTPTAKPQNLTTNTEVKSKHGEIDPDEIPF